MNSFLNFPKTYEDHLKEVEQREQEEIEDCPYNEKHDCKIKQIENEKIRQASIPTSSKE